MVTVAPTAALVGLKEVIFGNTLKTGALEELPAGLVTEILPVVAPTGTTAVMEVEEITTGAPADWPLKLTSVTESRLVPSISITSPTAPLTGEKLVTVGGLITVNFALVSEPVFPA